MSRNNQQEVIETLLSDDEPAAEDPPPKKKRGRGRPRKHPLEVFCTSEGAEILGSSDSMVHFRIPGKPRAWKRFGVDWFRRHVCNANAAEQKQLKEATKTLFTAQREPVVTRFDNQLLAVSVTFAFPKPRTTPGNLASLADVVNLVKNVLDAHSKLLHVDDKQIVNLTVQKKFDTRAGSAGFTEVAIANL